MKLISAYQKLADYPLVKDTLECLDFGFKCQQAITESLLDGKVNLLDVANVLKPLMAAGSAIEGFRNVRTEMQNLTPEGKAIIHDFVSQTFNIADDLIEQLVKETIDEVIGDISVAFKWANFKHGAVQADTMIDRPNDAIL